MATTFSIRLPERQREALKRRAQSMNLTVSAWVRHLIENDLQASSLRKQLEGIIGALDSQAHHPTGMVHPLKSHIRDQNWRP